MANVIHLKALAKINLGLDVIGTREDGYHLVRMIMQTIDLYDWVTVRKSESAGISLETNLNFLPTDEHNIAYQAVELLKQDFPCSLYINAPLHSANKTILRFPASLQTRWMHVVFELLYKPSILPPGCPPMNLRLF